MHVNKYKYFEEVNDARAAKPEAKTLLINATIFYINVKLVQIYCLINIVYLFILFISISRADAFGSQRANN